MNNETTKSELPDFTNPVEMAREWATLYEEAHSQSRVETLVIEYFTARSQCTRAKWNYINVRDEFLSAYPRDYTSKYIPSRDNPDDLEFFKATDEYYAEYKEAKRLERLAFQRLERAVKNRQYHN